MRYPTKAFRRMVTCSTPHFGVHPTGLVHVGRLVQGLPCWIASRPTIMAKNKILILADWLAPGWNRKKIEDIIQALLVLMNPELNGLDEAFTVYLKQKNHLVRLTSENLSLLYDFHIRLDVTQAPEDELLTQAQSQLNCSRDELQVVNDYWLDYVLSGTEALPARSFNLKDFNSVFSLMSQFINPSANLLHFIRTANPPIKSVFRDFFEEQSYLNNELAKNNFNKECASLITPGFTEATFSTENIEQLRRAGQTAPDNQGIPYRYKELKNLLRCNLTYYGQYKEFVNTLLHESINLQELTLKGFKNSIEIKKDSLLQLVELNLYACVSIEWQTIVYAAPNLKQLKISACRNQDVALKLPAKQLIHLKELILEYSPAPLLDVVQFLLETAPNLQHLVITKEDLATGELKLPPGSMIYLELLKLCAGMLSARNLRIFIDAAPNLKALFLTDFALKSPLLGLEFRPGCLPQLKELRFRNIVINYDSLMQLLLAAPGIKVLDLSESEYHELLSSHISITVALPHLEQIILYKVPGFNATRFKNILLAAPNIKDISSDNSHLLAEIAETHFGTIECLEFKQTNTLSLSDLSIILRNTPRLKTLKLTRCAVAGSEELVLAPGSLPELTELDLSDTELTSAALECLFRAAPKLNQAKVLRALAEHKAKRRHLETRKEAYRLSLAPTTISSASASSEARRLDADTRYNPEKCFELRELFKPLDPSEGSPHPGKYRLHTYSEMAINPESCGLGNAFYLGNAGDFAWGEFPTVSKAPFAPDERPVHGGSLMHGKVSLHLTSHWQALPSLSAHEILTRYHTEPDAPIELRYSTRDNLYYVRSAAEIKVLMDYTLEVVHPMATLPAGVTRLVAQCRAFGVGALDGLPRTPLSGRDYLEAILLQKKGSCRHRALVFKYLMAQAYPTILVRLTFNDCHAYAEIKLDNTWQTVDLGGYPARLSLTPFAEEGAPAKPLIHTAVRYEREFIPPSETHLITRALKTWSREARLPTTVLSYCQECMSTDSVPKRLIECGSNEELQAITCALMLYGRDTSQPVFHINSPDDLVCSAPYISRLTGAISKGPGGPLYDFIQANPEGVLVVNYQAFSPEELVRFNTLLDTPAVVDGTPIPTSMRLIGLLNRCAPNSYQGADFFSRFSKKEPNPLSKEQCHAIIPELPPLLATAKKNTPTNPYLELYHAFDWKERLLGTWTLTLEEGKSVLRYQEGLIQQALNTGATGLTLGNAPWDNPEFVAFWRQALTTGWIEHQGERIGLPDGFTLKCCEGYSWATLKTALTYSATSSSLPLNDHTITHFFNRYRVDEHQQLLTEPGYLEAAHGTTLALTLTAPIEEHAWAKLLGEAQRHAVTLALSCAPGVHLPKALAEDMLAPAPTPLTYPLWDKGTTHHTQVIYSADSDTTTALLTQNNSDYLVIDASELDDTQLLYRLHSSLDPTTLSCRFSEEECVLARALREGKRVVLKGRLNQQLANQLAGLILQRQQQVSPTGSLVIINEEDTMAYANPSQHKPTHADKEACLSPLGIEYEEVLRLYKEEPLARLRARLNWLTQNPGAKASESDAAWTGLLNTPADRPSLVPLNLELAAHDAALYLSTRLAAVERVLSSSPYVFLSGLSGVGKTTFVQHELKRPQDLLFYGEKALKDWAMASVDAGGRILLFIDEANLSPSQWQLFEGLFTDPPTLIIEGQAYPLSPNHRVCFAGNPVHYGDERHLATFFSRHGNSVWFDPLPLAVLHEQVLKKTLANTPLAEHLHLISPVILAVYRFLANLSTSDVLISPRELQMMALMLLSYQDRMTPFDATTIPLLTAHIAYQLAKPLVPTKDQAAFKDAFAPKTPLPLNEVAATHRAAAQRLHPPSRAPIISTINEFLALRHARQKAPKDAPKEFLYGGLGGVILQGEPGVGKSLMAIQILREHGFEQEKNYDRATDKENPFYILPASFSVEDKKALLIKAFKEGAVVLADELNSAPLLEAVLIELLAGSYQGEKPDKPGFMIIATQNPPTMAGRKVTSTALQRRLTTLTVEQYTPAEMRLILTTKGMSESQADFAVNSFQQQLNFAQMNHLNPKPTFRDLCTLADSLSRARSAPLTEGSSPTADGHLFFKTTAATHEAPTPPSPPAP